ncbi:MAG: Holliday junction resolvase RuvX [Peptostreptococcaceae bacterium]|nr:Holliday junction resolvase RuvX [Peptostreptococcaceae bacterium]
MEKILGLDIGEKRIGVAMSDLLGMFAQPVRTIERKSNDSALREIAEILAKEGVVKVVVGLPKNMDGSEGYQAEYTRRFAEKLKERYPTMELIYRDERLTSRMARQSLSHIRMEKAKEKKLIDTVAAVHILQNYLDARPK